MSTTATTSLTKQQITDFANGKRCEGAMLQCVVTEVAIYAGTDMPSPVQIKQHYSARNNS